MPYEHNWGRYKGKREHISYSFLSRTTTKKGNWLSMCPKSRVHESDISIDHVLIASRTIVWQNKMSYMKKNAVITERFPLVVALCYLDHQNQVQHFSGTPTLEAYKYTIWQLLFVQLEASSAKWTCKQMDTKIWIWMASLEDALQKIILNGKGSTKVSPKNINRRLYHSSKQSGEVGSQLFHIMCYSLICINLFIWHVQYL